ncbi:hypothetical protein WOLCODRAFT_152763 [Wolfiporia cocos MD-104 SS10]|uniref:Helicase C-terminal domain-containing protein n=1 Tax=Wolfiporia cocos (strain MD-104) TaxID=742152 RepID=A0A2H3JUZ8_WOLCO|nr:hypothetical protein WOLCODRAFT_152763 [Wolfiporia cocos MD-104 SS10]
MLNTLIYWADEREEELTLVKSLALYCCMDEDPTQNDKNKDEKFEDEMDKIEHYMPIGNWQELFFLAKIVEDQHMYWLSKVLQRMVNSLDFKGDPISGLLMYHEHIIQWLLLEWEQPFFNMVAHDLMIDDHLGMVNQIFIGKKFYLRIRQVITHLGCHFPPQILGPGAMNPSSKIDSLITLLKNHLVHNNTQPMKFNENLQQLVIDEDYILDECVASLHPNKIIVYCTFPLNIPMIAPFLQEHNIKYLQVVSQGMSIKQQSVNLKWFHKSGVDSPRMLLLSGIGMVGLNITNANILIIMDTLWSTQEDGQLIRRLRQHPQPKWVHIYWLIVVGTLDVFLNNVLFKKEYMHKVFTEVSSTLRELFTHVSGWDTFSSDDEIEFDEDSSNIINGIDDTIGPKAKGKSRVKSTGGKKKKTATTMKKSTMVTTRDTASSSKTHMNATVADTGMDNSDKELLQVPEKQMQKWTQKNKVVIMLDDKSDLSVSSTMALDQGTMLMKSTLEPSQAKNHPTPHPRYTSKAQSQSKELSPVSSQASQARSSED